MEIKGENFSVVYKELLNSLMNNPEYEASPRGQQTKEITDITLEIGNPYSCLYNNERRSSQYKYIAAELLWYFKGDRSLKYIRRYAKFWEHIAFLEKGTHINSKDENILKEHFIENSLVNSAYGDLIFKRKNMYEYSQYHWAFESLANDKDTRQSILHFNIPIHQYEGNTDFVCTLTGMFMIRDNKLNLTVTMRSNDAILGLPTDIPFFCTLLQQMYFHLTPIYPELEMGTYKHKVHSMHVYERHFDLINEMLEEDFIGVEIPKIEKSFINFDGSPTALTNNLFEWADDDVREPIIGNIENEFVEFLTEKLITINE